MMIHEGTRRGTKRISIRVSSCAFVDSLLAFSDR